MIQASDIILDNKRLSRIALGTHSFRLSETEKQIQLLDVFVEGGGSVIDCAKAAAALIPLSGSCAEYFSGAKTIPGKGLFFAAAMDASTSAAVTGVPSENLASTRVKR